MFKVHKSCEGWYIYSKQRSKPVDFLLKDGTISKTIVGKDYDFSTKEATQEFLDKWLDSWKIGNRPDVSGNRCGKEWYIYKDISYFKSYYLYPDGVIFTNCMKSKTYNGWYKTKEEAEAVLYKYLSNNQKGKNMGTENLKERLTQAVKDRDAIDKNIAQLKEDIESSKKVNWKDLSVGTVVKGDYGYRAVVYRNEFVKKLLITSPECVFQTAAGVLNCFNQVKIVGCLNANFDIESIEGRK